MRGRSSSRLSAPESTLHRTGGSASRRTKPVKMIPFCWVIEGLYSDARAVQSESPLLIPQIDSGVPWLGDFLGPWQNRCGHCHSGRRQYPVNYSHSRKQAVYTGRVQGVGFRATVAHLARDYPVTGWVRNDASGSVTLQAQGTDDAVDSFLDEVQTRQASFIATTSVMELPSDPAEAGFRIAR